MLKNTALIMLLCIVVISIVPSNLYAVCCGYPGGGHYMCKDGTYTNTCCGNGGGFLKGCNIFCCNCSGGCKESHNPEQCRKWCESRKEICYGSCGGSVECEESCDNDYSDCWSNCSHVGNGNCSTFPKFSTPKIECLIASNCEES